MKFNSVTHGLRPFSRHLALLIGICALLIVGSILWGRNLIPQASTANTSAALSLCCSQVPDLGASHASSPLLTSSFGAVAESSEVALSQEPALVVVAGSNLEFQLTVPHVAGAKNVSPTFGEFDERTGIYTAPDFMPPGGVDDLLILSADGWYCFQVTVRIIGDAATNVDPKPRFARVPRGFLSDDPNVDLSDFDFEKALRDVGTGRVFLLEEGQSYEPPLQLSDEGPLQPASDGWYVAPAMLLDREVQEFFEVSLLQVRPVKGSRTPRRATVGRPAPVLDFDRVCKNGQWFFTEYVRIGESSSEKPTVSETQYTVSVGIGAKIGVSAGATVTVQQSCWYLTKTFTRLAYRCENGVFRLKFRQTCSQPGLYCFFSPPYGHLVVGFPSNPGRMWFPGATVCNPPTN